LSLSGVILAIGSRAVLNNGDVFVFPIPCLTCPAGTFSRCKKCPITGLWSNLCTPCPNGTYSTYAATMCTACPRTGEYSPAGSTDVSACGCHAGAAYKATQRCECNDGYPPTINAGLPTDSWTCTACAIGSYSDGTKCVPCPAGSYAINTQSGASNSSVCQLCSPGSYSTTIGAVNPLTCILCDRNTFSSFAGASSVTACVPCPENSQVQRGDGKGATSSEECICIGNRYRKLDKCTVCIPNGDCSAGILVAKNVFWRPNTTVERFIACIPPNACQGPLNKTASRSLRVLATDSMEGCSVGFDGFMCGVCSPGYAWTGNNCVFCSNSNAGLIVLYFVLSILFVGYVYISVGSKDGVVKLVILLNYLQMLAQSYVVQSVKFLPVAEFAYSSVVAMANVCLYPFMWWQLWLWTMMIPWINIVLVMGIFASRLVYKFIHRRRVHPERPCNDKRVSVAVNATQAIIQLIFFNNLSIAKSCMIMFACVPIFDQFVTSANYSFGCGSALHYGFIAMSIVWIALFCVFVPTIVLIAIVAPRVLPAKVRDLLDVEFLIVDFRDAFKWWEVIFNVRRLVRWEVARKLNFLILLK
jgi:hypothetical protein